MFKPGRAVTAGFVTRTGAALVVLSIVLSSVATRAGEDSDRQRRLEEIQGQINGVRDAVDKQASKERSELAQLEQIERIERLLAEQLKVLDEAVDEQQLRVEDAERRLAVLRVDFDAKKAALKERLVVLYKMGEMSYARLLLAVEEADDLAYAYAYLSKMIDGDRQKVEAYRKAAEDLQVERTGYEKKAAELAELRRINTLKRSELQSERQKRQRAIEQIRGEKVRYLQTLAELEAAAVQLRKMLNEMPPSMESLSLAKYKGSIRWPHRGKVTLTFGLHKHPQFHTITIQNGIDIDATFGDEVVAVHGGRVVFCDWFRGYGNIVIIEHGDKFFTLYAHLSRFATALGDLVVPGQVIGYAGDTGSIKGAYLYFELRHGEKPLNPLDWLEKRKHAG
ncbi:MAG: peptidoglycan DD-metalloendopeptidase family protein [Acidobacteriota bacterium]